MKCQAVSMAMLSFYSPPNSTQEVPVVSIFFFLHFSFSFSLAFYSNHPMRCNRFVQCTFDLNSPNKYGYYLLCALSISLNIHVHVVCLVLHQLLNAKSFLYILDNNLGSDLECSRCLQFCRLHVYLIASVFSAQN